MSGNVHKFYPANAADNPDNVLEQAVGDYDAVFIIGYDHEGCLEVRSSTNFSVKDIFFCLDTFKNDVLNGVYELPEQKE